MDPPTFLTVKKTGQENVTWDEPVFHDNSGRSVTIEKSHPAPDCNCPLGKNQIFYNATDAFNNSVSCVLNITIEGITQLSSIK